MSRLIKRRPVQTGPCYHLGTLNHPEFNGAPLKGVTKG
jgi:hypothetical protein